MRVAGSAMVLGILILAAPAPSRAQCPPIVQTPEVQALVDECSAWTEVTYDPSLGFLPDQDPVTPWDVFLDTGATAQIINDRLVITGPGTPSPTKSFYQRDEPLLSDPNTSIYVVQVGLAVDELTPGLIPELEKYAQVGAGDGSIFPGFNAQLYQAQRLLVFGDFNGSPLDPNSQTLAFDFRNDTTYTLAVERGETAYLEAGGAPLLSMPYADFTANAQRVGMSIFVAGNVRAEYRYVQYCMCTSREPPLAGSQGKLVVRNINDSPDPFDPNVGPSQLSLEMDVLNLPGQASGQFDFKSTIVWEIYSPDGGFMERAISGDTPIPQTGTHAAALLWNGKDNDAFDLPSGEYSYSVRVDLIRTKRKGGKTKVVDSVVSPIRDATIARSGPRLGALDGLGSAVSNIEIGSSLHVSAEGLNANSFYEVFLTDPSVLEPNLANAYSYARIGTRADGSIPQFILWYQSGIVGCSERLDPDTLGPRYFRSLAEAEAALAGGRLRLSIYPVRFDGAGQPLPPSVSRTDKPVATKRLPVAPRARPLLFASRSDGCMIHSRAVGSEDLYVSGHGFAPFEEVQVSIVPHRWEWRDGDAVQDLTERVGANLRVIADETGAFTTHVWAPEFQFAGRFDIVAFPPLPPPPPNGPAPPDPEWDFNDYIEGNERETDVVLYDPQPQFHIPAVNLAVRRLQTTSYCPAAFCAQSYFQFSDAFTIDSDTVYAALDPVTIQASIPGFQYAAVSIVPHRDVGGWGIGLGGCSTQIDPATFPGEPGNDPSGSPPEIIPIKDGWFSGPFPIWYGPLQYGDWDVVADFGQSTPIGFVTDKRYDCDTDLLDGASRPGFVVADDPGERGPLPIFCAEYSLLDFFLAYAGDPMFEEPADLTARVCWPTTAQGFDPPGQHPLFIIQHGFHRSCTQFNTPPLGVPPSPLFWDDCDPAARVKSYHGYNELLAILASHGIIAVSIDAHDLNDIRGSGLASTDERAKLFSWHLRWWSHLNDPSTYDGDVMGSEFPDNYTIVLTPPQAINLNQIMQGHVDLTRIQLSGHSRGGEAAVHFFEHNNSEFSVGSISTIAPARNEAPPPMPVGVPFFQLFPASDCVAVPTTQAGFYEVVPDTNAKSALYIYGANHNWFNAVWANDVQDGNDGDDCHNVQFVDDRLLLVPKQEQQRFGEAFLAAFARRHLKNEAVYEDMLRGQLAFSSVDGVTYFPIYHHDDFSRLVPDGDPSAILTSPGVTVTARPAQTFSEFEFNDRIEVQWERLTVIPYIEINGPWNLTTMDVLSFRAAWTDAFDWTGDPTDPQTNPVRVHGLIVELRTGQHTARVNAARFAGVPRPYPHRDRPDDDPNNVMTTVRIPLRSFIMTTGPGVDLSNVDSVRVYFLAPLEGGIYLDDIEVSK